METQLTFIISEMDSVILLSATVVCDFNLAIEMLLMKPARVITSH